MERLLHKSIVARLTMLFLLALYLCGFAAYSTLPSVRSTSAVPFLWISSIHAVLGLFCLLFLRMECNIPLDWKFYLLLFLLPRLLVSPMLPWLSDDALRYVWDGNVLLNGFNPYAFAPNAPELSLVRVSQAELFTILDYTSITSIYPPLAEYAFAGSVWLGRLANTHWWSAYYILKMLLVVSEGIGLICVYAALRRMDRSPFPLAAYTLMPLPVLEIAGQAHVDGLLCAPLGGLLFLLSQKKYSQGNTVPISIGALSAVLGAIKILPAIVLLPIMRSVDSPKRALIFSSFAVSTLLLVLPLLHDTTVIADVANLTRTNGLYWQFNGAPYYALCYVAAWLNVHEYWLWMPFLFSYLRMAGVLAIVILSNTRNEALFKAILASFCVILLLSPKVHTWYFVLLLLVNILVGWKWLPVLASGSMLSYAYYAVQPSQEQYGLEMFVWGMGLVVGLWEWYRKRWLRTKHEQ
jgi:alpha-1,6-mannosyltransferase